jgi:predicted acylesterase/phospholipase RssA
MTIKHLVLSGGAYRGFHMFGAFKYLIEKEIILQKNLKTIHCVSVGSLFGALICLDLNLDSLQEYIIHKPWEKLFQLTPEYILKLSNNFGIYDIDVFIDIFTTLLKSKGLSKNITLIELYEFSNIELFIYSTKLSNWEKVEFSYKTHPDLKVIDACYMSSSLPGIFKPLFYNDAFHLDGGLTNSYPLNECLDCSFNTQEILSIVAKNEEPQNIIKKEVNIMSFMWCILNNIIVNSQENYYKNGTIKYELIIPVKNLDLNDATTVIQNIKCRLSLIEDGEKYAKLFLNYTTV